MRTFRDQVLNLGDTSERASGVGLVKVSSRNASRCTCFRSQFCCHFENDVDEQIAKKLLFRDRHTPDVINDNVS